MADVAVPSGTKGTSPAPSGPGGFRGLVNFYHEVIVELRKVTWPEHTQVRSATVAIIIFVLIFALVIWILDIILQGILVRLIPSLFTGG
ncbi:MAG: preprotein translocase subunit SecE [Gemmatimonadaceae bacterium]|nr:preprotein translocase subunit SecE [Gemmatimonadaceae bacterium]